jgi:hypothetical protein
MQGAKDLFDSERGVFAILLLIAATVLVIVGSITGQSWLDFMKWVGLALIGFKTVTTGIQQFIDKGSPPTQPPTASS